MTTKNFVVKNGITTGSITLDASSGNISGTNLSVTGVSNLGAVGNVKITGGSSGYILSTDGSGNLSFSDPVATQSPAPMPTYIAVGNTVTISSNYQGIFGYPITVDGTIVVDGILVDVNDATVPAGNINFVQYNAGNTMGGDANFYYTAINGTMTLQNETIIGNSTIGNLVISRTANLGSVANVKITGGTNGYVLQTDGVGNLSWTAQTGSGGSGSPGGANTQVQFNDAGLFGGNSGFTFNKTTGLLNVTGNITSTTLSTTGNITGAYILGNGSQLTGITSSTATTAGTVTTNAQPNITSTGTLASLSVTANANIGNIGTAGLITATGNLNAGNLITAGIVSATGNVTGAYILGNGSQLTGITATTATTAGTVTTNAQPNITSTGTLASLSVSANANIGNIGTAGIITATGNITGGNVIGTLLTGTLTTAAQPNITSTGTLASLSVTANANIGNIGTAGLITATGNLNAGNIITGGIVSATGNITGAYILGNGSSLSSITGANVTGAVTYATTANAVAGANVSGQVSNALVAGTVYTNAQPNITSVGTLASLSVTANANIGNIGTAGLITATGNLNAGNIITAGIMSSTGNATHGNIITGGLITATGNATVGNLTSTGIVYSNNNIVVGSNSSEGGQIVMGWVGVNNMTGQANSTWNMDVDSSNNFRLFTQNATGVVSAITMTAYSGNNTTSFAGNVSAPYFIGNGSQLTGIVASAGASITNGTSNVVVDSSGNVRTSVAGTANVMVVSSTTVTAPIFASTDNGNGTNFKVGDDAWLGDINTADTIGIKGQQNAANAYIVFGNSDSTGKLGRAGTGPLTYAGAFSATGNITGSYILGNGSQLTGVTATTATTAGTVTTAAQPNITSTGTLTSVTISGNITAQANINMTGYVIRSVGTGISAAGSTQGTATAIAKEINVVSTVASGAGVILPTAVAGMAITITNTSANSLLVYPATNGIINSLSANVAYTQPAGATLQFVAPTTTQWYTIGATYV